MSKTITEKYEANIHLNSLYDILSSLQSNGKYWYPEDINNDINTLIAKINKYITTITMDMMSLMKHGILSLLLERITNCICI